jgi:hypothetical protein
MAYDLKFVASVFVLAGLLPLPAATGQPLRPAVESRADSKGAALTPSGRVDIELREVQTEISRADGPVLLSVLVLFEPKSGSFSWRATPAGDTPSWRSSQFNDGQAAFLRDGEIVDFSALGGPPRLFIHTYRGHASNMDDAESKALKAASESISPRGDLDSGQNVHVVSLLDLGFDFINPPMSATTNITPKVADLRWDGKRWLVTLRARWMAEITLDANYNVVSMRKVK